MNEEEIKDTKVINLRHTYKGLHCDIAVDFPRVLHGYLDGEIGENEVPIEVCCFDKQRWSVDVTMVKLEPDTRYGRIIPTDECIKFCEEWVDQKLAEDAKKMTCKELIEQLQKYPANAIVLCGYSDYSITSVEYNEKLNEVNIEAEW